jgi:hypothetical protein
MKKAMLKLIVNLGTMLIGVENNCLEQKSSGKLNRTVKSDPLCFSAEIHQTES